MTARLAVLASGEGSNLQAILDACSAGDLDATVVCVLSDNPNARALARAEAAGVGRVLVHTRPSTSAGPFDGRAWDELLADAVAVSSPDFVVLAGFMRLLSGAFLDRFPRRVMNLHPACPGELPGRNSIERAFAQFVAGTRESSGVMVHLVPDEGVDDGPVLATVDVPLLRGDTLESFAARMHQAEHRLLVTTLARLVEEVSA
jgi:phosphoribosylglycinamide formyltransferase 1